MHKYPVTLAFAAIQSLGAADTSQRETDARKKIRVPLAGTFGTAGELELRTRADPERPSSDMATSVLAQLRTQATRRKPCA